MLKLQRPGICTRNKIQEWKTGRKQVNEYMEYNSREGLEPSVTLLSLYHDEEEGERVLLLEHSVSHTGKPQ